MVERDVGSTPVAEAPGQPAGVDAAHGDQVVALQPGVEVLGVAVVGRVGDVRAEDRAPGGGRGRLDVFRVGADVADMGEGEGDDLPGVGGICQDFLVAGHRGVEAELAERGAVGARAPAPEDAAIVQEQPRRRPVRFLRDVGRARGNGRRRPVSRAACGPGRYVFFQLGQSFSGLPGVLIPALPERPATPPEPGQIKGLCCTASIDRRDGASGCHGKNRDISGASACGGFAAL